MTDKLPPIYFYIPQGKGKWSVDEFPQSPDEYWNWQRSRQSKYLGRYDWTLQTYLHLQANDFPCQLVTTMPTEGIVVFHRWFLKDSLKPGANLLLICIQADSGRHPYAQLHIVQNPYQKKSKSLFTLWESYYIPFWSQAGLIPRNSNRGDKFENIAFFGDSVNLAPELQQKSWQQQVNALGLNWQIKETYDQWNDYSDVDLVLAVRSFGHQNNYKIKPANKLFNAWRAGVPAILGYESAFQAERKSKLDYIEVTSLSEITLAIKHLQDNKDLRQAMVKNGLVRAQETNSEKIVNQWQSFLIDKAIPAYKNWYNTSPKRQQLFLNGRRYLSLKVDGIKRRLAQH